MTIKKFHAKALIKNGTVLEGNTLNLFRDKVKNTFSVKNKVLIGISGSPGSGKTFIAKKIKSKGFFDFKEDEIFIIDDLKDLNNKKYTKKELHTLINKIKNKAIIIFDYRVACYLKNLDFLIVLLPSELERLKNLGMRSIKSLQRYGNRFYRLPPIPLNYKRVYILKDYNRLENEIL